MNTVITWTVTAMNCYPQADNQTDVVFTVHWTCSGVQDTYSGSVYSTCSVPTPSGDNFTPYADLTQEQVLGWIWANGVDKDATEAALAAQIAEQKAPKTARGLPWSTP
jgi:hypothetical protein